MCPFYLVAATTPCKKCLTFWGFSEKPQMISTKKLKSKDPTQWQSSLGLGKNGGPKFNFPVNQAKGNPSKTENWTVAESRFSVGKYENDSAN